MPPTRRVAKKPATIAAPPPWRSVPLTASMIKALKEKPRYLKMKELIGIYPIEAKFLTAEFKRAFGKNFVAVAVPKATSRNSVSVSIPGSLTKVFAGKARVLTEHRPDGIYPLPIDLVLKEVRGALTKNHTIVAMPREAIGG